MNWQEWFEEYGELVVPSGTGEPMTPIAKVIIPIETMYQAFKARLMDELIISHEISGYGKELEHEYQFDRRPYYEG